MKDPEIRIIGKLDPTSMRFVFTLGRVFYDPNAQRIYRTEELDEANFRINVQRLRRLFIDGINGVCLRTLFDDIDEIMKAFKKPVVLQLKEKDTYFVEYDLIDDKDLYAAPEKLDDTTKPTGDYYTGPHG